MQSDFISLLDAPITLVPLRARDGTIRAFAQIDAADADMLSEWTWRLLNAGRGYAARFQKLDGRTKSFLMHRAIMGVQDEPPTVEVDHINGDGLDNRRSNLRIVTHAQNMQNRRTGKHSSSGLRGVIRDGFRGKWRAVVVVNRKKINIGRFDSMEEADCAVRSARARLMTHSEE